MPATASIPLRPRLGVNDPHGSKAAPAASGADPPAPGRTVMGWPHEIARLWLNAGAAWIAVGSSSAAPEWISVPEGQQTRRVWRTTAQETWPELLYWSGLLALAAAGACVFWSLSLDQVAVGTQTQRRRGRTAGPPTTLSVEPRSSFRGLAPSTCKTSKGWPGVNAIYFSTWRPPEATESEGDP